MGSSMASLIVVLLVVLVSLSLPLETMAAGGHNAQPPPTKKYPPQVPKSTPTPVKSPPTKEHKPPPTPSPVHKPPTPGHPPPHHEDKDFEISFETMAAGGHNTQPPPITKYPPHIPIPKSPLSPVSKSPPTKEHKPPPTPGPAFKPPTPPHHD